MNFRVGQHAIFNTNFKTLGGLKNRGEIKFSPTITPKPITYHKNLMFTLKLIKPLLVFAFLYFDAVT